MKEAVRGEGTALSEIKKTEINRTQRVIGCEDEEERGSENETQVSGLSSQEVAAPFTVLGGASQRGKSLN